MAPTAPATATATFVLPPLFGVDGILTPQKQIRWQTRPSLLFMRLVNDVANSGEQIGKNLSSNGWTSVIAGFPAENGHTADKVPMQAQLKRLSTHFNDCMAAVRKTGGGVANRSGALTANSEVIADLKEKSKGSKSKFLKRGWPLFEECFKFFGGMNATGELGANCDQRAAEETVSLALPVGRASRRHPRAVNTEFILDLIEILKKRHAEATKTPPTPEGPVVLETRCSASGKFTPPEVEALAGHMIMARAVADVILGLREEHRASFVHRLLEVPLPNQQPAPESPGSSPPAKQARIAPKPASEASKVDVTPTDVSTDGVSAVAEQWDDYNFIKAHGFKITFTHPGDGKYVNIPPGDLTEH